MQILHLPLSAYIPLWRQSFTKHFVISFSSIFTGYSLKQVTVKMSLVSEAPAYLGHSVLRPTSEVRSDNFRAHFHFPQIYAI